MRELCEELQTVQAGGGGLRLLVPTPNQRFGVGASRDRWAAYPVLLSRPQHDRRRLF